MTSLEAAFGPLELRVLHALWRRGGPATVRDLHGDFPSIAYTTLMTTLDRLHRKGVLARQKDGRAFAYRPRCSHDELRSELAHATLADLLRSGESSIRPIISMFVDAVSARDAALLDELEALVREKRDGATSAVGKDDRAHPGDGRDGARPGDGRDRAHPGDGVAKGNAVK